jgi:hypothetical protein
LLPDQPTLLKLSKENTMSLPSRAIERLFDRLAATYGNEWISRWQGLDGNAVKTLWAHELSGFAERLDCIAWALENLPARSPNVIEFRNLCRSAPQPETPRLPEPKIDPERLKQELAKLSSIRASVSPGSNDGREWARRIIGRLEAGERINPATLKCAKDALRMTRQVGE